MFLLQLMFLLVSVVNGIMTPMYGGSGGAHISYVDQGRVYGVLYWGVFVGSHSYNGIIIRKWISDDLNLDSILLGDRIPETNCTPFTLSNNQYINGYRIIYNNFVRLIGFHTSDNHTYTCSANQSVINQMNDTIDTQWIIMSNMYLSGFQGKVAWLIDQISFEFQVINLTFTPTKSPSQNPTVKLTDLNVEIEYGIVVTVTFQYEVSKNDTVTLTHILENIAKNITNTIVSNDCVLSDNYNVLVSTQNKITTVNATIMVCDEVSQNELLIAFSDEGKLQQDLVNNINNQMNLQIYLKNVTISSDIINHFNVPKTTQIMDTTNVNKKKAKDGNIVIIVIIGIVLLIMVTLLCVIVIRKVKRERMNYATECAVNKIAMSEINGTNGKYCTMIVSDENNENNASHTQDIVYNHNEQNDEEISDGEQNQTAGFDDNLQHHVDIQSDPIVVGDDEIVSTPTDNGL